MESFFSRTKAQVNAQDPSQPELAQASDSSQAKSPMPLKRFDQNDDEDVMPRAPKTFRATHRHPLPIVCLAICLAALPMAQAQDGGGAPSAPAGTGGAPATGAAALENLSSPMQMGQAPSLNPFVGSGTTPDLNVQQIQMGGGGAGGSGGMGAFLAACGMLIGSMMTHSAAATQETLSSARRIEEEAMSDLDRMEPDYIEGANREQWEQLGSRMHGRFTEASGDCQQKFITQDGRLGPWGQYAMTQMNEHRDVYENPQGPRDTLQYCPRYNSFEADQRKQFWTWFFLSLASPESSCRATAQNHQAPNGTALGLFQLESPACRRVGFNFSSQDLLNPYKNIQCAVALFAQEMRNRDSIMVGHSRDRTGTYWGPLRNDDHNLRRGGDIRGANHLRSLLSDFDACK
jgi:hypothetical protein